MAHYIDADLLRAEIDKRYAEYRTKMKTDDFTYYEGMADALDHLEQYIDSPPREQPMDIPSAGSGAMGTTPPKFKLEVKEQPVEELEEELEKMWLEWCEDVDYLVYASIARHFAEWGAKYLKPNNMEQEEKKLPDGLEEAADAHIRRVADAAGHPGWDYETQDIAEAFKAGAEWMAEQGEVLTTETVDELCYDCHNRLPELIEKTGLSADDRVELIVRKI